MLPKPDILRHSTFLSSPCAGYLFDIWERWGNINQRGFQSLKRSGLAKGSTHDFPIMSWTYYPWAITSTYGRNKEEQTMLDLFMHLGLQNLTNFNLLLATPASLKIQHRGFFFLRSIQAVQSKHHISESSTYVCLYMV